MLEILSESGMITTQLGSGVAFRACALAHALGDDLEAVPVDDLMNFGDDFSLTKIGDYQNPWGILLSTKHKVCKGNIQGFERS